MLHEHKNFVNRLTRSNLPEYYFWGKNDHVFCDRARSIIAYFAFRHKLVREDQVYITTSSDSSYVSSCVTSGFFNFCSVSRVLTPQTKIIFVIHEFGVPHPKIKQLAEFSKKNKMVLVEDCAHAVNSFIDGNRIGCFGDYTLYSLPKLFPINKGGLLVSRNRISKHFFNSKESKEIEQLFKQNLCYLNDLTERRKKIFVRIRNSLSHIPVVFEYSDNITPFFLIFKTKKYKEIYGRLNNKVAEWGLTYVKDWFCVPIQPLIDDNQLNTLIETLKKYVK